MMMISDIEIEIHFEYMRKYEQWKSNRYVSCVRTGGIKKLLKRRKYRSQKENKIMRSDDIRREKRYGEDGGTLRGGREPAKRQEV